MAPFGNSYRASMFADACGWGNNRDLLAVFKDGSTYDNALRKVYGFDTAGLEKEWKAKMGA